MAQFVSKDPCPFMNGRNAVASISFLVVVSSVAICLELPRVNPSWEDLVRILDEAPGGLALIAGPFELTNCGNEFREYLVERDRELDIVCCNGDCIIDCPLVQFRVSPNATMTFESLTLQNTIRSTVVVEPSGALISRSTRFLNNQVAGDGGSILAMQDSTVEISRGRFENNIASNGGAIYTQGSLVIRQVSFWNNQAINLGGAIYGGDLASASVMRSTFGMNSAVEGGPAIFCNAPSLKWSLTANKGCMNVIDNRLATTCDGVEWLRAACFPFSGSACDTPTSTPTTVDNESDANIAASQFTTMMPTLAADKGGSSDAPILAKQETAFPSFLSTEPTSSPQSSTSPTTVITPSQTPSANNGSRDETTALPSSEQPATDFPV